MGFLSDFADQDVVVPIELCVALLLLLFGRVRLAASWAGVMVAGNGTMLLLKLWFERCGIPVHRVLYSPSGHALAGTMVYGGLCVLICRRRDLLFVASIGLAVMFAMTRIVLRVHSPAEAALGALLGLCCVYALHVLSRGERLPLRIILALAVAAMLIATELHGHRSGIEQVIQRVSMRYLGWLRCGGLIPGFSVF